MNNHFLTKNLIFLVSFFEVTKIRMNLQGRVLTQIFLSNPGSLNCHCTAPTSVASLPRGSLVSLARYLKSRAFFIRVRERTKIKKRNHFNH
jgi:hypothetical protein